ncbi:MAG: hypothetical protein ACJAZ2_002228, partial [Glaciecola sp.]
MGNCKTTSVVVHTTYYFTFTSTIKTSCKKLALKTLTIVT